jgi:hypothetical protein
MYFFGNMLHNRSLSFPCNVCRVSSSKPEEEFWNVVHIYLVEFGNQPPWHVGLKNHSIPGFSHDDTVQKLQKKFGKARVDVLWEVTVVMPHTWVVMAHAGVVAALRGVVVAHGSSEGSCRRWRQQTMNLQSRARIRQSPWPTMDCQSLEGLQSGIVLYYRQQRRI